MTQNLKILVVILLSQVCAGSGNAAEIAGNVLAISGDCTIESAGARQKLKTGDAVHPGDSLEVAASAKLKLHMVDGSVLALAGGSRLTITAYDTSAGRRDARLGLSAGLLHAVVSTMSAPSRFEVETATAVAAVRSTDWYIEGSPALARVGVVDGVVALSSRATGTSVEIAKGYGAKVEKGKDPIAPRPWETAEFDEYRKSTTLP